MSNAVASAHQRQESGEKACNHNPRNYFAKLLQGDSGTWSEASQRKTQWRLSVV